MQIIDFARKGNTVRFFLGENGKQWGDDWNDAPYEHNAGAVYQEYIKGHKDISFGFEDEVFEPCDGAMNSGWCKQDMIERKVPCLVVIPAEHINVNSWETFDSALGNEHAIKYYFGDEMTPDPPACKKTGCEKTNVDYAGVCPNHR